MAIITPTDLNTYLGESDTTTAKTAAVSAACSAIEQQCNRVFDSTSYTEWYRLRDDRVIALKQYPLITLTSVASADTRGGAETAIAATDYDYEDGGTITLLYSLYAWVKVVYTAGYATIPADLKQIACEMAAAILSGATIDRTLKSESIGDYSYTNKDATDTLASFVPRLTPYKKLVI